MNKFQAFVNSTSCSMSNRIIDSELQQAAPFSPSLPNEELCRPVSANVIDENRKTENQRAREQSRAFEVQDAASKSIMMHGDVGSTGAQGFPIMFNAISRWPFPTRVARERFHRQIRIDGERNV